MKRTFLLWTFLQFRSVSSFSFCEVALQKVGESALYNNQTNSLTFSAQDQIETSLEKCLNKERREDSELVLELVAVLKANYSIEDCCTKPCEESRVHSQVYLSKLKAQPSFAFHYVEGEFFFRYRQCSCSAGYCFRCRTLLCGTEIVRYGNQNVYEHQEHCGNSSLSSLRKVTRFSYKDGEVESNCTIEVTAVYPLCTSTQFYSKADLLVYKAGVNESCPENFDGLKKLYSAETSVQACNSSVCPSGDLQADFGLVNQKFDAETNSSYCVLVAQNSPVCEVNPEICLVYFSTPVECKFFGGPALVFLPLSEPIFIGCVCGILFLSLLLLLWTVVKCKKEQNSPNPSPEPELIKDRNIPRSLTIDEMEHICRLRHQELVLVYFPDTERFKDLNRLFKHWLISLTTLNVNDVTDVYDEKYSEGPDGVLKSPDGWVSNLLSDPERRVILVTSKLAYECLIHLRKGVAPPKFPNCETHSQLLLSILKHLDSEMFRGNYRRLICVRYEDLKICDRKYGSESFNIVPGTEYLLPQHLEDVARWIHPVEAKPGLWAEHRSQVRQLFDALKQYRLQEDNIFTVSFYDGDDGNLIGHEFKSGF